jgi:DNA polymerase-3 subunit alpha
MATTFTHLHVHMQYSMLDGAIRIEDLIEKMKEYSMNAVDRTDTLLEISRCKQKYRLIFSFAGVIMRLNVYLVQNTRFFRQNVQRKTRRTFLLSKDSLYSSRKEALAKQECALLCRELALV